MNLNQKNKLKINFISNSCCLTIGDLNMNFKEIVMNRYAAKKFNNKIAPEEKINELKELIRYAPSSFNMQTWKIKVITDQETKEKLLPASMNQPQVTTCSHLLVFCSDTNLLGLIDNLKNQMLANGAEEDKIQGYIDMMIGFVNNLNDEQKLNYAKQQVFIALGNALNGAKSLGLDSCPMGGFNAKEYSKILDLPDNLIPSVLCPVGYATDTPRPKMRFNTEDIFI